MRWPEKHDWPQWFFFPAGHTWVGIPLGLVACILVIYGVVLTRRAMLDRQSLRRMLLDSYDFWLGQFFLGDSVFYFILMAAMFKQSESVDVWVASLFIFIAFPAGMAFRLWLVARRVQG